MLNLKFDLTPTARLAVCICVNYLSPFTLMQPGLNPVFWPVYQWGARERIADSRGETETEMKTAQVLV